MKPSDIQADLSDNFRIQATYGVALQARNAAISMIYGGHAESFSKLPQYLYLLEQTNPGTYTDLDVGEDGRFRYLFMVLGVSRAPWLANLRKIIVVDGTHLKGRNKGILFIAANFDANEQIFPLAFGLGPIENDVSWTWFMLRLRAAFAMDESLVIVSDQHKSIANAVSCVFPDAQHGLCYFHLSNKLTRHGDWVIRAFYSAAYAYRSTEFHQAMNNIHIGKPSVYEKLMEIGPEKWSRLFSKGRRYALLTSNTAESINSRLLEARRLPILAMLEAIRHMVESWFDI